jgi:hypothetical protein
MQRRNQSTLLRVQRGSVVDGGECRVSDAALSNISSDQTNTLKQEVSAISARTRDVVIICLIEL